MDATGTFVAEVLTSTPRALASAVLERMTRDHGARWRDVDVDLGPELLADIEQHIHWLAAALAADRVALFLDHVLWLRAALRARGMPDDYAHAALTALHDELGEQPLAPSMAAARAFLTRALQTWAAPTPPQSHPIETASDQRRLALEVLEALLAANGDHALRLLVAALDAGVEFAVLCRDVLRPVQAELGWLWQNGEISIADEHYASGIVGRALVLLATRAGKKPRRGQRVVLAAIDGEQHDLGLRIVAEHFELAGFDTVTLGANTPTDAIVDAVQHPRAALLGLAMQRGVHVRTLADTIARVRAELGSSCPPILVGGRPFLIVDDLWRVVGADDCATDASSVVAVAERCLGAGPQSPA